jgi:thiamine biosynthesis lipoprotein
VAETYLKHEIVMGTAISVELVDVPGAADLTDEAFAWFRAIDARFSTYKSDSEVSRLDRGEISALSDQMRLVLDACEDLRAATGGFFDAYASGRLDPSGYVKGWSAQVASDRLLAAGAVNHCVNAGGDVRVRGHASTGAPWRIGIRHPYQEKKVAWVVTGTDLAVATSGTYERGLHVIDPFRGVPATFLRSVTVTGPDLALADAYATTAVAMGDRGPAWLAGLDGYESAVVTEAGDAMRSDGFPIV